MNNLDQSKYSIKNIFEKQMANSTAQKLLFNLNEELTHQLDKEHLAFIARTHCRGITYLCNDQKAFLFVNVRQKFISITFFTGNSRIDGLKKANWGKWEDNTGSETFRIFDNPSLKRAVLFAMKAYKIALSCSR